MSRALPAVVLVVVLLVLSAATYLLLGGVSSDGPGAVQGVTDVTHARTERDGAAVVTGVPEDEGAGVDSAPALAPAPTPRRAAEAWSTDRVVVRCVDASTGAPVPGAEVYTWSFSGSGESLDFAHPRPVEWLVANGLEHRADERGEVAVELGHVDVRVAAVAGPGRGLGWISVTSDEPVVVVELSTEPDLVVQVLDQLGRPVSGVEVTSKAFGTFLGLGAETDLTLLQGTSDASGRVAFEWRAMEAKLDPLEFSATWVEARVLGAEVENVPFDAAVRLDDRLTIEVPSFGSVLVELVDANGARLPGSHEVKLFGADPSGAPAVGRTEDGRVRFEAVAVGAELSARWEYGTRTIQGPALAGDEVTVRFQPEHDVVVGRLVDPQGSALADVDAEVFGMWSTDLDPMGYGEAFRTDAGGRFALVANGRLLSRTEPATERWRFVDGARFDAKRLEALASVEFPGRSERRPVHVDLGDVVLAPIRPLVSGFVVDGDGRPIAGARVRLFEHGTENENVVGVTKCDDSGHFLFPSSEVLDGRADRGELALRATTGRAVVRRSVPFHAGEEVHLEVESNGSVSGRIVFEGLESGSSVSVGLHPVGEPRPLTSAFGNLVASDGSFRLTRGAGVYDLVVAAGAPSARVVVARVEGIVVKSGVAHVDPRLDPLRVDVSLVEVEVVDHVGAGLTEGKVHVVCDGRSVGTADVAGGRARMHVSVEPVDLWIVPRVFTADAPAAHFVEDVRDGQRVELPRRPELDFELTGDRSSVALPVRVSARWTRAAPAEGLDALTLEGAPTLRSAWASSTGPLVLPAAGTWTVQFIVRDYSKGTYQPVGEPWSVEVAPGSGSPQTIEVEVSQRVLDEARALANGD